MSERTAATLTERQQYWLEQVRACEASGKTIAAYAAAHELSAQAMYAGKQMLVRKGILPRTRPCRFQRVQMHGITAGGDWYIQLPNGVSVAFSGEVEAGAMLVEDALALDPFPAQPTPKNLASAGLLAHISVSKY